MSPSNCTFLLELEGGLLREGVFFDELVFGFVNSLARLSQSEMRTAPGKRDEVIVPKPKPIVSLSFDTRIYNNFCRRQRIEVGRGEHQRAVILRIPVPLV